MFEDYKKAILEFYRIKKESHRLPLNLEAPRRDRLRAECAIVFLRKNSRVDQDFIRSIFDPTNEYKDQIRSIEKFDLDRFRPLISFLTIEGRSIRDDKLVKLLAWLIDFPSYTEWRDLSEEEIKFIFENAAKNPDDNLNGNERDEDNGEEMEKGKTIIKGQDENKKIGKKDIPKPIYVPRFSPRFIIISCIILLFVGTTSFVAWENSVTSVKMPNQDEKCMYWNEDHYEPVKCDAQIANATIIPLDLKKLQHQRKINLSDTLTSYSLGKVWYKGFVKDHEFFTAAGPYPTDTTRVLKKLTPIILAKYISNNRYLQTRLIWLSYAIIFVVLCGFGASRLKKEVKQPVEKSAAEEEEPLNFTQQQTVNC